MSDRQGGSGWTLRGPEVIGGILVVIGLVAFLGNANVIRVSWNLIWPLLIIAVGGAILLSALRPSTDLPSSASVPRDGTDQLELELSLGAGTFRLHGGAAGLVDVRANRGDVVTRTDHRDNRTRVRLSQDLRWFPFAGRGAADWEIQVASDVSTALMLSGGAGRFDLDLADLRVVDARISVGAADARITLPRPSGEVAIRLSSGAASVTIQVPPGVESRVVATGGLLQVSGRTETPGYAAARDRVTVNVSGGASSVRVV